MTDDSKRRQIAAEIRRRAAELKCPMYDLRHTVATPWSRTLRVKTPLMTDYPIIRWSGAK